MSTPSKLKYAYSWGKDVVNIFVEKYPRATYNFARIISMPVGEVRHYLIVILCSGNSLKWEVMKRLILSVNDYEKADIDRISTTDLRVLYRCLRIWAENDQLYDQQAVPVLDNLRQRSLV